MFDLSKAEEAKKKVDNGEDVIIEDVSSISLEIEPLPFTWGIKEVDEKIGLLGYNKLVIYAGEAGSGKTTASLQQAIENAKVGNRVAYMSLEMGKKGLIETTAKKNSGIKLQTEVGEVIIPTPEQKKLFKDTIDELLHTKNLDIIGYGEGLTIKTFERELYRLCNEYDLVFIDNLGMIGRKDGIKEIELLPLITDALMKARVNYKSSIVALHHVNKGNENQKGPRGRSAIRGSGKVIDDADKVVMIHREKSETGFDTTSFLLLKDRDNGINASIGLIYNKGKFVGDVF